MLIRTTNTTGRARTLPVSFGKGCRRTEEDIDKAIEESYETKKNRNRNDSRAEMLGFFLFLMWYYEGIYGVGKCLAQDVVA